MSVSSGGWPFSTISASSGSDASASAADSPATFIVESGRNGSRRSNQRRTAGMSGSSVSATSRQADARVDQHRPQQRQRLVRRHGSHMLVSRGPNDATATSASETSMMPRFSSAT